MMESSAQPHLGTGLADFLEAEAQQLAQSLAGSTRAKVRPAVVEARREGRALLLDAFRWIETLRQSPPEAVERAETAAQWRAESNELLNRIARLRAVLEYRPYALADSAGRILQGFYQGNRLGVIRRVEPVRIRFFHDVQLRASDPQRFSLLDRSIRRVRWFLDRVDEGKALDPPVEERSAGTPPPIYEWEELVYGSHSD